MQEFSLLTGALACELLRGCPYVDEFIEFDPYRKRDQGPARFCALIWQLRRRKFDVALMLNRSFHSALVASLARVPVRASWSGFEHRDWLLNRTCRYDPDASEVDCFLNVGRSVDADLTTHAGLGLWLAPDEIAAVPKRLQTGSRTVCIQPGASHGYKRWPVGRFAQVANHLGKAFEDLQVVTIGGHDECAAAQELLAQIEPPVLNRTVDLTGKLTLRQSLAALSYCSAFIGNDTAIRHAAVALGVPSLALFGPTNACKWGNAAPPDHLVIASTSGDITSIPVETVLKQATDLLCAAKRDHCAGTSAVGAFLAVSTV